MWLTHSRPVYPRPHPQFHAYPRALSQAASKWCSQLAGSMCGLWTTTPHTLHVNGERSFRVPDGKPWMSVARAVRSLR